MRLSPLLYSLFTHDCKPLHDPNIVKFDDTTVIAVISNNSEAAHREEVGNMACWSQQSHPEDSRFQKGGVMVATNPSASAERR